MSVNLTLFVFAEVNFFRSLPPFIHRALYFMSFVLQYFCVYFLAPFSLLSARVCRLTEPVGAPFREAAHPHRVRRHRAGHRRRVQEVPGRVAADADAGLAGAGRQGELRWPQAALRPDSQLRSLALRLFWFALGSAEVHGKTNSGET